MRIDAFNHIAPKKFFEALLKSGIKDMGKRMQAIPALHDIDLRRKIVGMFPDYAQVLSLPMPPIEVIAKGNAKDSVALARIGNDGMAELVAKYPNEFPAFLAHAPMLAEDAGVGEMERAVKELGAIGVQIFSNVAGKPLDRPEFAPFFAAANRTGTPLFLHPTRGANHPDYLDEEKSLYEIWWTFGWPYETSVAMARLVFSGVMDKNPKLKIVAHHLGAMVPYFEGRVGPGMDQLGTRTSDADYVTLRKNLKKRPLDYFKHDFWADSAAFGSRAATICGLDFYGVDKVVFASDCPFDPEKGTGYIRETIKILDELRLSKEERDKIYCRNLERLTGKQFAK